MLFLCGVKKGTSSIKTLQTQLFLNSPLQGGREGLGSGWTFLALAIFLLQVLESFSSLHLGSSPYIFQ